MALVVEDGTGLATAESYISVADANARHTAFGNTGWTGTDAAKEAALRRATAYMVQTYRARWKGERINSTQALDWPRWGAVVGNYTVPSDEVPTTVEDACADLALKALTADLSPDQERAVVREKVGSLETEYSPYSSQATRYTAIDALLGPFLTGSASMVRVGRA